MRVTRKSVYACLIVLSFLLLVTHIRRRWMFGLMSMDSCVWDTLDGQGYQFETDGAGELDAKYDSFNYLPYCNKEVPTKVRSELEVLKNKFTACITPIVNKWRGQAHKMNLDWVKDASVCDNLPEFRKLDIDPVENLHEVKWTIFPKCKEENVMVTLGVGHDTKAEEKLNRTLPNTKFYGADPIIEPNRQLYSAFGKFFPFAIGKTPGFTKFRVLPNQNQRTRSYSYQHVTTIDLIYFLKGILKLSKIDFLWIDIEGGEFEFLDQFYRGGLLDANNITVCQFNLEVHSKFNPSGAQVFHDFIFKVLEDQRYVFLNSMFTEVGVHRMFFVNVENEECVAKFIH